jgi:AcrR family transcriptional regulator
MSAREANKELNRRKILVAARELLREGGIEALAMRALAERAQVSSRTPYNLFGSKTDVLLGLLDEPMRRFGQAPPPLAGNRVIPAILAMVDVVYGQYAPEIDYYRTIYWGVMSSDHHAARAAGLIRAQRIAEMLIRGAMANRELRADSDPAALAAHVIAVIAGLLGLWAAKLIDGADLVAQARRSLILCCLGYCEPGLQPDLSAQLAALDRIPARDTA